MLPIRTDRAAPPRRHPAAARGGRAHAATWSAALAAGRPGRPPRATACAVLAAAAAAALRLGAVPARAAEPPAPSAEDSCLRVDPGEHTGPVTSVATTRAGDYIVTAAEDRTARIWDGATFALLGTLRPPSEAVGPEGRLYAAAISPDGSVIAAAGVTRYFSRAESRSSAVYLFDRRSGALVRSLPGFLIGSSEERVTRLGFSPDGQRLVVAHDRAPTAVFEVATGRALSPNLEPQREVVDVDFDPAGRLLLTLRSGWLRLLDRELRTIVDMPLGDRRALGARFSPDGTQVAVLYPQGPRVELRAAKDLKRRRDVPGSAQLDDAAQLTHLVFGADGKSLYAAGRGQPDGPALLWRFALGPGSAPRSELQLGPGVPLALATRPGGGVLFAGDEPSWGAVDGASRLVHKSGGRHPLAEHPEALLIDATGDRVELPYAPGGDQTVRFQVSTLQLLRAPPVDPALRPPRIELPGHELAGWRGGNGVRFDEVVLTGPPEYPAAVAIAPGGRSFLLGTNERLTRYLIDRRDRDGCPLPVGEGAAPPCARALVDGALAVGWSGDGRYAVAALRDGSVRWYSGKELREQLALFIHRDGKRWALWRPDGRFAASVGGDELVGCVQNRPRPEAADFFPLARLRPSRERPQEAAAALRPAFAPASAPEAAPPVAPPALRQLLPPTLRVTAPADGAAISTAQVVVHVKIEVPPGQELTALRVLIDGRLAVKLSGEGGAERDLTVPVPPRDCTLAVIAQSAAGSSPPAQLRLRWTGPPPQPTAAAPELRARLLVLAVGVGAYERSELRLTYPAKDASDLAALLKRQRPGLYRSIEARVLTDAQASRQAILGGLEWLYRTAAAEDTLVVLLAGHGITDPGTGQYYFLPVDADPQNPLATMLPASALQQALSTLPGRVVLLLDTCHAGDVLPGRRLRGLPEEPATGGVTRLVSDLGSVEQGVVVLTAAVGTQSAQESPDWGNGAFTKALLEGLRGQADYRKTGRVTVNMLDLYLSERVRELTRGAQTPATAKPSTIPDFPLVLSP